MRVKSIGLLVVLFVGVSLFSAVASAQNPVRRLPQRYYPPAGPTLSPYLNLFRRDQGPIDNYNFFVRPRQDLRYQLNQQNAELRTLNQGLQQTQNQLRARPVQAGPTGTNATFMNYSHYYRFGR